MKPVFLVLADLSVSAQRAAAFAARLAEPVGAELVLLHVEAIPVIDPGSGLMVGPAEYLTPLPDIAKQLTKIAKQLPVPATVEVYGGVLSDVLQQTCVRYQPELLVLGLAEEQDWLDRLLLNQALPALRHTRLPLLLVPAAAQNLGIPHRVAVASDGAPFRLSKPAKAFTPVLSAWAPEYTVVHIAPLNTTPREMHQALTAVRASGLLPIGLTGHSYQVQHPSPATGLVGAAADIQADLLMLIARPRSFLGGLFHRSVTAEVARRGTVPLLLLPAEEEHTSTAKPAYSETAELDYL